MTQHLTLNPLKLLRKNSPRQILMVQWKDSIMTPKEDQYFKNIDWHPNVEWYKWVVFQMFSGVKMN